MTAIVEPRSPASTGPEGGVRAGRTDDRQLLLVVGVIALIPVLVGLVEALVTGWLPVGEEAMIALHAEDVFSSHPPLLGMATSLTTPDGGAIYHPGPLLFFALAPFVQLLGPGAGSAVGAAVINGGSIVLLGWIGARTAGARVGAVLMVGGALTVLALGGAGAAVTIHNPQVAVLPLLVVAVAAWGLGLGDDELLPLLAATGSLVVQASVVYASFVLLLGLWGVGGWWRLLRRRRDPASAPSAAPVEGRAGPSPPSAVHRARQVASSGWSRWRRLRSPRISRLALGQAAFVAAVALTTVLAATGATGTLARTTWSVTRRVAIAAAGALLVLVGVVVVAVAVVGAVRLVARAVGWTVAPLARARRRALLLTGAVVVLVWLPPLVEAVANEGGNAVALARSATSDTGEVFGPSLSGRVLARVLDPVPVFVEGLRVPEYAAPAGWWWVPLAGLAVALWWRARARGDRPVTHLLVAAALMVASGAFVAARLPTAEGLTLVHLEWVVPAAVLFWVAVAVALGWELGARRTGVAADPRRTGSLVIGAVGVVVAVVASLTAVDVRLGVHDASAHVPVFAWQMDAVRGLHDGVAPALAGGEGPYLIDYAGPLPFRVVAEGLVTAVEHDGVPTVVVESLWVGWRRDFRRHREDVRWGLTVAPEGLAALPPGEPVARWEPDGWDPAAFEQIAVEVHEHARRAGGVTLAGWADAALDRTLAGSAPGLCRVYVPQPAGCRSAQAYADDPASLLELPPEALLRLYMSGAVAAPVLPDDLVRRGSAVISEGMPMTVYLSPLEGAEATTDAAAVARATDEVPLP